MACGVENSHNNFENYTIRVTAGVFLKAIDDRGKTLVWLVELKILIIILKTIRYE